MIRPARPADLPRLHALIRELAAYERLEAEATQEALAGALFGPAPRVFCDVADRNGDAVGLALWFYTFSTFRGRGGIWIEDLYVRPDFRGAGYGRALVAALARRCAEEGLARLEWSVLDWNAPAIAFYESLGARQMTEWTICRMEGAALRDMSGFPCAEPARR